MSNKHNKLSVNMLSYAGLQFVNLFVGIFLPRLFLERYGSEINGVISTINSFTSYFAYLEAGLGLALIHSLFKPLAVRDAERISGILSYSKQQYRRISYIYFVLVILLSVLFPAMSSVSDLGRTEFFWLVLVIGLYGALDFYSMAKYRVLLTADQKEYIISGAMIIAQLLRIIFVWAVLQYNVSVVYVKAIPVLTLSIRSILLKLYVKRQYPAIMFSAPPEPVDSDLRNRWDALLLQISIATSMSLPALIVSRVLGFKEASVYAVYNMVVSAVVLCVSALSSGVSPLMGKKLACKQDVSSFYDIYEHGVAIAVTIVFSVTAIMFAPFIDLYTEVTSDVKYSYPVYGLLFSVWGALYSYRIPITALVNASALYRENRRTNIVNLVIQLVFGWILTWKFGIPGLLVAMIFASLHRNIAMGIINSKKVLGNGIDKSIVKQMASALLVVISYYLGSSAIQNIEINVIKWIITAIIATLGVSCMCIFVYSIIDVKITCKIIRILRQRICVYRK